MLAVVLVSAGLEAWVHFSALARKLILASWLACAVGGAVIFIFRRILAEWHEEHVALHVEAALPGLKNGLINTIRLAKEPWLPSPSLANQAVNEVAANVKQFDFGVAIDRRGVVRFGVIVGILALTGVLAFIIAPARFANALHRILRPTDDVPALGNVMIDTVDPGDCTVVSGDDMTVKVTLKNTQGRIVTGTLYLRPEKGQEVSQPMGSLDEATFVTDIPDIRVPFRYRILVGTTQSKTYAVRVAEKPLITSITLEYDFPRYSGLEPRTEKDSDGNIKALRGSFVTVKVGVNKKMKEGHLLIDDKQRQPLLVSADGVSLTSAQKLTIMQDGTYTINVKDTDGYTNKNPVTHFIRAVPDEKPQIKIALPGKDVHVPVGGKVSIAAKATDDYGVKLAELVAKKGDAAEQVAMKWEKFADAKNAALTYDWEFSEKDYKLGDSVSYYIRVTDNNEVGEPSVVQSAKFRIEVRDKAADTKDKREQLKAWRDVLEKTLQAQEDARKDAEALFPSKPQGETPAAQPGKASKGKN